MSRLASALSGGEMRRKTTLLVTIAFFWLFPAVLKPQVSGDTDGGKVKFQSEKEMVITAISGQLTRCETYMDYLTTGGWCRSFPTRIGYVTDFSIGYMMSLYSGDYEAGDSFRWNFKGPNKQNITGGFDCLVENGFYCWVSTKGSKSCPSSPGKPAATYFFLTSRN
jgi:hypothetical protein